MEKEAGKTVAMRKTEESKKGVEKNVMGAFGSGNAQAAQALSADSAIMMASEAERLVEGLRTFGAQTLFFCSFLESFSFFTELAC